MTAPRSSPFLAVSVRVTLPVVEIAPRVVVVSCGESKLIVTQWDAGSYWAASRDGAGIGAGILADSPRDEYAVVEDWATIQVQAEERRRLAHLELNRQLDAVPAPDPC